MINGEKPTKIQQFIDCGAVVRLDDAVTEYGVVFIHPDLPPMKLVFQMDPTNQSLPKYHIEPIAPKHGVNTQFAIRVHDLGESIISPPSRIIKPGEH